MKLAFLCNNMKSTNGVERVLSQRLSLLAESGRYEVYLITYNQYSEPLSFPISKKIHYVDLGTRYINHCSYHGLYQYVDRYISKLIYRKTIEKCINRIMPDVVTCVDIHLADLVTILTMNIPAVKVVECHCGLSAYFCGLGKMQSGYQKNKSRKQKEKIVETIGRFDRIVVMTETERKDWNLGDRVICIPNMIVVSPSMPNISCKINHRVISVGRYAYQKGYDMLVNAWKIVQDIHPDWSLHIYGSHDGDMGDYDKLVKIIADSEINSVFLHPATNDVFAQYCKSDFYVMSSRYESFGLVLIEAMSCGLPVVSFDCKYGPLSIVKDGKTGVLVPQNDVIKMSKAICSMIENIDNRQQMSSAAYLEAKKYHPDSIMPLWHEFYKSLEKGHSTDA